VKQQTSQIFTAPIPTSKFHCNKRKKTAKRDNKFYQKIMNEILDNLSSDELRDLIKKCAEKVEKQSTHLGSTTSSSTKSTISAVQVNAVSSSISPHQPIEGIRKTKWTAKEKGKWKAATDMENKSTTSSGNSIINEWRDSADHK